jgi:hypothetical protein
VTHLLAHHAHQAAGRRDQHMLPAAHRLHLRAVVDAAIDDGGAQLHGGARGRGHVGDLFGGYNGVAEKRRKFKKRWNRKRYLKWLK